MAGQARFMAISVGVGFKLIDSVPVGYTPPIVISNLTNTDFLKT